MKEYFEINFEADFWFDYARTICRRHKISEGGLKRSPQGEHVVFLIDKTSVIKIYNPHRNCFEREKKALEFVQQKTALPVPEIIAAGEIEGFSYLATTQLGGHLMTRQTWLDLQPVEQIGVIRQLAEGLRELHSHNPSAIDFDWRKFVEYQSSTTVERQQAGGVNSAVMERLPSYLEESLPLVPKNLPPVFLHGDIHFGNLRLLKTGGNWKISGVFDFADSLKGFHEYDFLAIGVLMIQGQGDVQREFFRAYGYRDSELDETLRRRLMLLTILYECSDLRRYALRLKPEAVDFSLDELERAIWNFVE